MGTSFIKLAEPAWQIVVRTVVIYLVLLLSLRLFGKREIGQFTIFDLVLILLVANSVQPAVTGPDSSLLGGLLIIATLLVVNYGVSLLELRFPFFREAFAGEPTIIALDGKWVLGAMRREGIDIEEAEMALREHGVEHVEDVRLAVLETDGTISVVPRSADHIHIRRRVRYTRPGH